MVFDAPYFYAELAVAILSGIVLYIRGIINSMNNHINQSVTETRVREIINEKMEVVKADIAHTEEKVDKLEEALVRIEGKLDTVLLKAFKH